ncbi:DeoR/GlpR family DNA-binding transcription regulator [Dolosigranulum pigrum]|uniref:DeoR/GlpR family DNA-binding transcription regulator n=1 Tax=Dolosigranulum pigrum TaxID=29394 RepID=UPI000DC5DA7C|nr:DeoR/GlpR family DNA-binding transcription regulator [Dolosigranulum pigrum]RAN51218.1 DeoR family transcriptional regulator [Dolosigranulum pigrum]
MLTVERFDYILDRLQHHGVVHSSELMKALDVSESTIRRDLSELEERGELVRIHGGAKLAREMNSEQSIQEKTHINQEAKETIAKYAASLVEKEEFIYMDAGSTTFAMLKYLQGKNITVVTNGIQHASQLSELGVRVYTLGGRIKNQTQAIIGSLALEQLSGMRFSRVFLGMNSIDIDGGFTTPDPEEAVLKRHAAEQGERLYILADSSKFGGVSFARVLPLDGQTVIVEQLSDQMKEKFDEFIHIREVSE